MPSLPDTFSPWLHLFEQLIASHNPIVERSFAGIEFGDISTTLGGMYTACIIQPDDTAEMVVIRLFLYYFVYKGNLPAPIYGIPTADYQAQFKFHPQVKLIFKEDYAPALTEANLPRATAQISFRLVNYTTQTITLSVLQALATEIKAEFALGNGYAFEKGTIKYSYTDYEHGLALILTVESEAIGNALLEKILPLVNASFDSAKVSFSQSRRNFPTVPGTQEILGKAYRKPRERPITQVRFVRAECHIHGKPKPVILIDKTGKYNGLVQFF